MKRFKFTLEAVLKKRSHEEDSIKIEFAKKNAELFQAGQDLLLMQRQLKGLQELQKEKRASETDLISLKYSVTYRNQLKKEILAKGQEIQSLGQEAESIRRRLVKATQKKRALELLKDKKKHAWNRMKNAKEQMFIDDISQQGFLRKLS